MKRTLAILLAILLIAMAAVSCGKSGGSEGGGDKTEASGQQAAKATPEGRYVCTEMGGMPIQEYFEAELGEDDMGMSLDDYLKLIGIESLEEFMVIELKEDGTVSIQSAGDEPEPGTWTEKDGKIQITTHDEFEDADVTEEARWENGKLIIEDKEDGSSIVLEKKN